MHGQLEEPPCEAADEPKPPRVVADLPLVPDLLPVPEK
jgi:hypothetical protein